MLQNGIVMPLWTSILMQVGWKAWASNTPNAGMTDSRLQQWPYCVHAAKFTCKQGKKSTVQHVPYASGHS